MSLANLQTAAVRVARAASIASPFFLFSQLWLSASASEHPKHRWSCLWYCCSQLCRTRLVARPATMKTQHQSPRLALWLSAMEATRWCRPGFQVEEDSLVPSRFAHRRHCWLRRYSVHCFISYHALAVSAEAWHSTLYLITPWQHLPRLGMLFYLITPWQHLPRLGILLYILSRLGSICRGLACYSISCHALAVSAEAWHPPRLGVL